MSINKFNQEGYYDPTAYEALKNISRKKKKVNKKSKKKQEVSKDENSHRK